MKKESWLKSPWSISIGTAIFSLFLTVLYDYLKNKPLLSTTISIIRRLWQWVISFLNFDIKVWWLLIGLLLIIFVVAYLASVKNTVGLPAFLNYREEQFPNWKWSWSWAWSEREKAWVISELSAHCPRCETPLVDESSIYHRSFNCPRCGFSSGEYNIDEPSKVELVILDNVRRKKMTS